ncbi:MAG TPA: TIGR01777 family oxidoreductase [Candidatus Sulfotelmatobacter sp.]|nr:TIGR01777 family oxidoreductase [Candidatus Sulfotelmatobacter sp.]
MTEIRGARIAVSGASGMIGSAVVAALKSGGAKIARLARPGARPDSSNELIPWNPAQPMDPESVSGFNAVIHLAGESVFGRWSAEKKARIRDSRIPATANLAQALAQAKVKPRVFLCASAIGYYGNRSDEILNEDSAVGTGFAADLARDWEEARKPAADAGIRTVRMRIGIVLARHAGALAQMLPPFRAGIGGRVGSGKQWMSWIDLDDLVGAVQHILKTESLAGAVNLVGPDPVTNIQFTKTLASVLHRPALFPIPAFVMRLAFGEMADELLLASDRVEPKRLLDSGYTFQFPTLRSSLEHILKG